jgi:hypothetical protein
MNFTGKEFSAVKNPRFGGLTVESLQRFLDTPVSTREISDPTPNTVQISEPVLPEIPVPEETFPVSEPPVIKNISSLVDYQGITITAGPGISINPPVLTRRGTIGLQTLNPSPAGTFVNMCASVNHQGIIIAASNGTVLPAPSISCGEGLFMNGGTICLQENNITSNFLAPSIQLKGTPTAPTPDSSSNNDEIATTSYVNAAVNTAVKAAIDSLLSEITKSSELVKQMRQKAISERQKGI